MNPIGCPIPIQIAFFVANATHATLPPSPGVKPQAAQLHAFVSCVRGLESK